MKQRYWLLSFFLLPYSVIGQSFYEISNSFTLERLISYEKVVVDWKMPGVIQAEINNGLNFLLERQLHVAAGSFTRALAPDSTLWIAFYYRGAAFKQVGNLYRAERDFKSALKINPTSFESLIELGKTLLLQKDYPNAQQVLKQAITVRPNSPIPHYWLGEIALNLSKLEDAQKYFTICTVAANQHAARVRLALLAIEKAQNSGAGLKYLNEVIQADSSNQEALLLRGVIRSNTRPAESIKDFNLLVSLSPTNLFYLVNRAYILVQLEEYDQAFSDFQKILNANARNAGSFLGQQTPLDKQLDLQYAGYYALANMYSLPEEDLFRIKKAYCLLLVSNQTEAAHCLVSISNFEKKPLCLYLLGLANEHGGNHEVAWKFYESAVKLDSEIIDAQKKIGIYNSNVNEWEKAENNFSNVLILNDKLTSIYSLRGVARYNQEKYKDAIVDFTIALKVDSLNSQCLRNRALAYEKIGSKILSTVDKIKYKILDGYGFYDVRPFLSTLLIGGDTLKVLYFLDKLIKLNPSIGAIRMRTGFLINSGRWDIISNDLDLATTLLEKGIVEYPIDEYYKSISFLFYAQGLVNIKHKKQVNLAIASFTKAFDANPDNSNALLERGKAYLLQGELRLAQLDFKAAAKMGNNEAKGLLNRK